MAGNYYGHRIVSAAVGSPVTHASLHDIILTRTSFGTATIWTALGEAVPVNPPLLKGVMDALLGDAREARISELVHRLTSLLDELLAAAAPRWESSELLLGGAGPHQLALTVPLLKLDSGAIEGARAFLSPRRIA